jgi:hypothetical protein
MVGDRVTVWLPSCCGSCAPCPGGQEQNCADKRTLGLLCDGAFAEDAAAFAPMITHRLPLSQIEGGAGDARGHLEGDDPAGRLSVTFRRAAPASG